MVYTVRFFSSKCILFHNSNAFGSCIIQILYTGCDKIKKNNSGAKRLKGTTTNRLMGFERKILKKIFGPTYENGSWRMKINEELDKLIKHEYMINFARA
jgi:hypothetical protein